MQLDQFEMLSYVTIMHQPVTFSSSMQTHVQIKHSLGYLQDLIPTLAGLIVYNVYALPGNVGTKSCRYASECFTVVYLYIYIHLAMCV